MLLPRGEWRGESRWNGTPGPGGTIVASAKALIALFPLSMNHRIRHQGRKTLCAERLREHQRLAAVVLGSLRSCRSDDP